MSLDAARAYWEDGAIPDALRAALAAHDAAPDVATATLLARIYRDAPNLLTADRVGLLIDLLTRREIDPAAVSGAGWRYLLRTTDLAAAPPADMAHRLEASDLALTLLREDIVARIDVELALTAVRRWLLLEARRGNFPRLCAALIAQAALNGGAWPFDATERPRLADFAAAYLPPAPHRASGPADVDPVTRTVAGQYEAWPYPVWTRILHDAPQSLAERLRAYDPQGPAIGDPAEVLIAGCGTGRQVARWAQRSPRDRFTAIDLSEASLRLAAERCCSWACTISGAASGPSLGSPQNTIGGRP